MILFPSSGRGESPDRRIGAVSQPMYERAVKVGWISLGTINNE
jgi:hypothetical protein